jgi:kynurenine formamidase
MTPERILTAVRLVKRGRLYNLAVPLDQDGPQHPFLQKTSRITYFRADATPGAYNVVDDVVMMEAHSGTHMDALGHVWRDGQMWNGKGVSHVTRFGVTWAGIHNVPGLVARGVMLDIPRFEGVEHLRLGDIVTVDAMEGCARSQNIEIRPGDVVLVRTGWEAVFQKNRSLWSEGEPGPDIACAGWLKAKDIIALGADNPGVESYIHRNRSPLTPRLHTAALRDLGVYLIEHVHLDALARDQVYEFLFVAAPLRLTCATGSPFSPLAIV